MSRTTHPPPPQSTPDFALCSHLHPSVYSPGPTVPFVSTGSTFFALLGWIRPLLQPQSCYLLSTFHSSFPFTSSVANLSVCMSALSSFCQSIPANYSIKCFCIPSVLLHWALAMAEIVSQVEPIIFGLKYIWGFKSSFVFFRTNTSQYFKWKSLSLFQVMKVSTLCDLMPKYNQSSFYPNSACLSLIILWYWKFKLTQSFNPKKSLKCRDWERYIWKVEPSC